MKLEHIALNIRAESEIENFYVSVMKMQQVRTFVLRKLLAQTIFGVDHEVPVYLMKKSGLIFEIFVVPGETHHGCCHICFSIPKRELFIKNAVERNYKIIRIQREQSDLIFLSDNSGNKFEIK